MAASPADLVQTVEELEALPYATVLWDDNTEPGRDALYQIDGMGYSDAAPWVLWDRGDRWCWFEEAPLPLRILHIPDAGDTVSSRS